MPASSRWSGSPRSGSRRSAASAACTFRFGSGGSRRRTSATSGRSATRRFATSGGALLSEEVVQLVGAPSPAVQRAPVSQNLRVELWVGHNLERRVEACGLVVTHEDRCWATAPGDRDALVPASHIVDEAAELRLRLGQRKRSHDLTSLLTNSSCGKRARQPPVWMDSSRRTRTLTGAVIPFKAQDAAFRFATDPRRVERVVAHDALSCRRDRPEAEGPANGAPHISHRGGQPREAAAACAKRRVRP